MTQAGYKIDGDKISDYATFIAEFNRGFIFHVGGNWNGNLDAFNDYLSWADGRCRIRWSNSAASAVCLGYDAMASWLQDNLTSCHPTNRKQAHVDFGSIPQRRALSSSP